MIREKKHRLDREQYIGEKTISFTLCVKERKKLFVDDIVFKTLKDILLKEAEKFDISLLLFLFMPDHCHLLVKGNNENSDVKSFIDRFKQKSGFWLAQNKPEFKWQKDYYDHILRDNEDLKNHLLYILNNPIREKLVDNWKDYNYKGSSCFDLDKWGEFTY